MKIFGGKNQQTPSPTGKSVAKKKRSRKRIVLFSLLVTAFIIILGMVYVGQTVRPPAPKLPDVSAENPERPDDVVGTGRKPDYYTILACVTDKGSVLTDSMMLIAFDAGNDKINVLNIPRDTLSADADRKIPKINGANAGGIEQTIAEVQQLVGYKVDHTAVINLDGLEDVIDAMGGIEYDIPFRMEYGYPGWDFHISFKAGKQKLTGEQAVLFLRWRKNNPGIKPSGYLEGDIGRIKAQQQFLKTLALQMLTPTGILSIPKVIDTIYKNLTTDLSTGEMLWFAKEAMAIGGTNFDMHVLPGEGKSISGQKFYSGSYYVPDEEATLELVNEFLNPYTYPITQRMVNFVDIETNYNKDNQTDKPIVSGGSSGSSKPSTKPTTPTTPTPKPEPTPEPEPTPPIETPPTQNPDEEESPENPGQDTPETPIVPPPTTDEEGDPFGDVDSSLTGE